MKTRPTKIKHTETTGRKIGGENQQKKFEKKIRKKVRKNIEAQVKRVENTTVR